MPARGCWSGFLSFIIISAFAISPICSLRRLWVRYINNRLSRLGRFNLERWLRSCWICILYVLYTPQRTYNRSTIIWLGREFLLRYLSFFLSFILSQHIWMAVKFTRSFVGADHDDDDDADHHLVQSRAESVCVFAHQSYFVLLIRAKSDLV